MKSSHLVSLKQNIQKIEENFLKSLDIGMFLLFATNAKAMDNARNIELEVVDVKIKI